MTHALQPSRPPLERAGLLLILLVALLLRLPGIRYGLPALNDPDELMFEMGAVRMLTKGTLNPGWFGHPATTTMYLLALVNIGSVGFGFLVGWWHSLNEFLSIFYGNPVYVILPGRLAMVAFGVLTVALTARLGRELFDGRVGLLAAALVAFAPLHVTYSQHIRSDMMATAFMLLVMLAAVRIAGAGRRRDWWSAAGWLALAITTKWPFALAVLSVAGAAWFRGRNREENSTGLVRKLAVFVLGSLVLVLLISPYLLLDYPTLLRNIAGEVRPAHLGATGGSLWFNLGWYLSHPIYGSFGLAGSILVAIGLVLMLRDRLALAVIGPVVVGFLVVLSTQTLIWERWALPLMPLLAVAGALAGVKLADLLRDRIELTRAAVAMGALCASIFAPQTAAIAAKARERSNDTRQRAAIWAAQHIPPGSELVIEHFGFDLQGHGWGIKFPMGTGGCVDALAMLKGKIPYSTIDAARGGQSNLDLGTLPSNVRASCQADYAILTHYDRYAAERDKFPAEYASYQAQMAGGQIVATFKPVPGESGGWVMRVVRLAGAQTAVR